MCMCGGAEVALVGGLILFIRRMWRKLRRKGKA